MTYETALDTSFITRHRLAATLTFDTPDAMSFIYLEYLSYYAWQAIAAGYLSLSFSIYLSFPPLLRYYFSRFVLRLIDLTSI
ncbi:hypothetical protein BJX62DRAFT_10172 [Aspergillus germanicus]